MCRGVGPMQAYPYKVEAGELLPIVTLRTLFPAAVCLCRAAPSLLAALVHGLWIVLLKCLRLDALLGAADGPLVEFWHVDTETNRRLGQALKKDAAFNPTPYLCTGDVCTLAPFLLFGERKVRFVRSWISVANSPAPDGPNGFKRSPNGVDDEACALDVSEVDQANELFYLVLHGLNGGSGEPFIQDFVSDVNARGSSCAVLIARGLMGTNVRGAELFNGARTSDVAAAVKHVSQAFPGKAIVLVGFSMGAIIAANYVTKAGDASGVLGCVAISGTMCGKTILGPAGARSRRLWQPMLSFSLKQTFVAPNAAKLKARNVPLEPILQSSTVDGFDTTLVCAYHGYKDVEAYYEDMAAAGAGDLKGLSRLKNLAVPLLVLHAKDDPITPFEACLAPLVSKASEHVFVCATRVGGHVGWPQGDAPGDHRWKFSTDVVLAFANTVAQKNVAQKR
ncbi:Alpha/Beta hydrolase protein [Pelagophyceae sp. CCMP2097]|nr:Alpha/Beta hydrolase protein [Pelagophyceae sp. CCMP2097]